MPAKKKTPTARRKSDKAEGHFIPDFRLDSLSAEAIGLARLAYSTQENRLDGYLKMSALLPDSSPLKRVLDSFYRKTPIALEIPFFSFITYLLSLIEIMEPPVVEIMEPLFDRFLSPPGTQ